MNKKIYIASDHAGFELKKSLKSYLKKQGYNVHDFGAHELDLKDDYPDFISKAAKEIHKNPKQKAIILGGSGQGEAMTANRYKNVRAAVYYGGNEEIIPLSREHNNANILSLGARFLTEQQAKKAVALWLDTKFTQDERHERRIKKIDKLNT